MVSGQGPYVGEKVDKEKYYSARYFAVFILLLRAAELIVCLPQGILSSLIVVGVPVEFVERLLHLRGLLLLGLGPQSQQHLHNKYEATKI